MNQQLCWAALLYCAVPQEAQTMAGLRHPHVVSFLGLCTQPPLIVSECCPRGSLFDILREARASEPALRALDWPRRLQLVSGPMHGRCPGRTCLRVMDRTCERNHRPACIRLLPLHLPPSPSTPRRRLAPPLACCTWRCKTRP